jgi:outer membrane protein assembly factor BamB
MARIALGKLPRFDMVRGMKFPEAINRAWCSGILLAFLASTEMRAEPVYWPDWRGPEGTGVAPAGDYPLEWSPRKNIRWRVPLPDRGNGSPVVWGDQVFITQAIEKEGRRTVMCFARGNGELLWQSGVAYDEPETTHRDNPYASASPVTDGERVIATFGSAGVFCYDMNGKELWSRDLGKQVHTWGNASSPVLYQDLCIVYHGPGEGAFMVALHKETGKTVWQREDPPIEAQGRTDGFRGNSFQVNGSFSRPIVIRVQDRDELIMSYASYLVGMEPQTGRELWRSSGLNPLVYTSPIYGDGVVVAMGGFTGTTIAVKPGGSGDVTETHQLWQTVRTKNRLGSGVIYDGHVYILNTDGVAECLDLKTGKVIYEERLRGTGPVTESWSSMTLVGDRIYISNRASDTIVLRAAPQFEVLSVNPLHDGNTNSSPAFSEGEIWIRTDKHLWCIGHSGRQAGL